MSVSSESEVRDAGEGKQEALRALLNSLVPDEKRLPGDADVSKLAEKLDEFLASKGGLLGAQIDVRRDAQGRLLNEEGLPIIEILEPIIHDPSSGPITSSPSPSLSNQFPSSSFPNRALNPATLAARRRERDRILDILEREEEEEFAREAAAATAALGTSSSSTDAPALSVSQRTRSSIEDSSAVLTSPGPSSENVAHKPKKQKSVSFADPSLPAPEDEANLDVDWGDVVRVPMNLRKMGKAAPSVMKELVVERSVNLSPSIGDSDDEDHLSRDEGEDDEDSSDGEVPAAALHPLDDQSDDDEDDDPRPEAETDLDEAMLQREIALAYYARRNQIGSDVISGPLVRPATVNRDNAQGLDIPASRFRQSRLDGDPRTLIQSAIQFGKVVDGELVASEQEKEGEETGGDPDMTEQSIARLMHHQDDLIRAQVEPVGDDPSVPSLLGSIMPSQPLKSPELKPNKLEPQHPLTTPSTNSKQQPASAPAEVGEETTKPFPPMVVESGFGFDPAFQTVAQKKPNPDPTASAAMVPVAETVKERPPSAMRSTDMSQLAQTKTARFEVSERNERSQLSKPKRMSKFRAERAGYI